MILEDDVYRILGLKKGAKENEIKQAYKQQALKYHPDKSGDACAEMFKKVNDAYSFLVSLSEEERKSYDEDLDFFQDVYMDAKKGSVSTTLRITTNDAPFSEVFRQKFNELCKQEAYHKAEQKTPKQYYSVFESDIYVLESFRISSVFLYANVMTETKIHCSFTFDSKIEISPKIALNLLNEFLNGKCFGEALTEVKKYLSTAIEQLKLEQTNQSYLTLYQSICNIFCIEQLTKETLPTLINSLDFITRFASVHHEMVELYVLLSNKYYRNLVSECLHMYWDFDSESVVADLQLADDEFSKKIFDDLKSQLLRVDGDPTSKSNLKKHLRQIVMLRNFEDDSKLNFEPDLTSDYFREKAFKLLDWIPVIMQYSTYKVRANIFLKIGLLFIKAAESEINKNLQIANEQMALSMFELAVTVSKISEPESEYYALIHVLKYISLIKHADDKLSLIIKAYQKRALILADVFPFLQKQDTNIKLLFAESSHIPLMRELLHFLYKSLNSEEYSENLDFSYDRAVLLNHVYEACLRNWYEVGSNLEIGEEVRVELMKSLLAKKDWNMNDVRRNMDTPWHTTERDENGWFGKEERIPFPVHSDIKKFQSLESIIVCKKTGRISFNLHPGSVGDPVAYEVLTFHDVIEMFDKSIYGAYFSLDPIDPDIPYNPLQKMAFGPSRIYRTQFLNTLLITDYILKCFTQNLEVRSRGQFDTRTLNTYMQRLPLHLKQIFDEYHKSKNKATEESIHRFWIVAEEAPIIVPEGLSHKEDTIRFAIGDMKMVVKKNKMVKDVNGNLVDITDKDEGWDIFVYAESELRLFKQHKKTLDRNTLIFIKDSFDVYFYENKQLSPKHIIQFNDHRIRELFTFQRDKASKVLVEGQAATTVYQIYKLTKIVTAEAGRYHNFSKEYVLTQELTNWYNALARYIPEFGRLRELSKIALLIKNIMELKERNTHALEHLKRIEKETPGGVLVDNDRNPITKQSLESLQRALCSVEMHDEEVDLSDKCLWVPSIINRNAKGVHFSYGGVLVNPRGVVLQRGSEQYNSLHNRCFNSGFVNVNSQQLAQTRLASDNIQGGKSTMQLPNFINLSQAAAAARQARAATDAAAAATAAQFRGTTTATTNAAAARAFAAAATASSSFRPTNTSAPAAASSPFSAADRGRSSAPSAPQGNAGGFSTGAGGSGGGAPSSGGAGGGSGTPSGLRPRGISPQAHSAANALRLRAELALKEANILDSNGRLTKAALASSAPAIAQGSVISNPSVVQELTKDGSSIKDWSKFSTNSVHMSTGKSIQVHFYRNVLTGEVNYTHKDFKIKDPVPLWGRPKQEYKVKPGE